MYVLVEKGKEEPDIPHEHLLEIITIFVVDMKNVYETGRPAWTFGEIHKPKRGTRYDRVVEFVIDHSDKRSEFSGFIYYSEALSLISGKETIGIEIAYMNDVIRIMLLDVTEKRVIHLPAAIAEIPHFVEFVLSEFAEPSTSPENSTIIELLTVLADVWLMSTGRCRLCRSYSIFYKPSPIGVELQKLLDGELHE